MISIIIPSYNSGRTIKECIGSINAQSFSGEKEIIVVDDGSADNTADIVANLGVKLVKQAHMGPATARNRGVEESKGDIVVFTDADCVADQNWLENMVRPFSDTSVMGVSGTYRTKNTQSTVARFVGYEIELRHERMKKFESVDFIGTYSAAYRKDVFLKFSGFDTDFKTSSAEDPEMSFRLAKAGFKLVFNPSAFVYHRHPDSVRKYLKQKFQRGYWRVLLYKKHPEKIKGESYTPPTLLVETFLTGLALLTAPLTLTGYWCVPVSLIALVALLNVKFYAFMFGKEVKSGLLSLPLVFMRNAAYGFGILAGFLKIFFR